MILKALGLMQSAPHPKVEIIATDQKPKLRAMPGFLLENLSKHSQPRELVSFSSYLVFNWLEYLPTAL